MLLEVGLTMRSPAKNFTLKREHLSIKTPDGTTIPLATQKQYAEAGYLRALNQRMRVMRDSINYFPVEATRGCSIQFFANLGGAGPSSPTTRWSSSTDRGCVGRLYFHVPGGIKVGQHWLVVNFGESVVEVPFRTLTKEEAKAVREELGRHQEAARRVDEVAAVPGASARPGPLRSQRERSGRGAAQQVVDRPGLAQRARRPPPRERRLAAPCGSDERHVRQGAGGRPRQEPRRRRARRSRPRARRAARGRSGPRSRRPRSSRSRYGRPTSCAL